MVAVAWFLVVVCLCLLIGWGVYWGLGWLGCPETPRRLITAVCVLLLFIYGVTGGFGTFGPFFRGP